MEAEREDGERGRPRDRVREIETERQRKVRDRHTDTESPQKSFHYFFCIISIFLLRNIVSVNANSFQKKKRAYRY